MADIHVALKDGNSVATAIFESSTSPGVIYRGQIDQITGRILVDSAGGSGGALSQVNVTGSIDSTNVTFTIPSVPNGDIILFLARQQQVLGIDYTISSTTITYLSAPDASLSGQPHVAYITS